MSTFVCLVRCLACLLSTALFELVLSQTIINSSMLFTPGDKKIQIDSICLSNRVFLSRDYRMIAAPLGFYVLTPIYNGDRGADSTRGKFGPELRMKPTYF